MGEKACKSIEPDASDFYSKLSAHAVSIPFGFIMQANPLKISLL